MGGSCLRNNKQINICSTVENNQIENKSKTPNVIISDNNKLPTNKQIEQECEEIDIDNIDNSYNSNKTYNYYDINSKGDNSFLSKNCRLLTILNDIEESNSYECEN